MAKKKWQIQEQDNRMREALAWRKWNADSQQWIVNDEHVLFVDKLQRRLHIVDRNVWRIP